MDTCGQPSPFQQTQPVATTDLREAFGGKKIVVTGGTGSIGGELVRQLLTGEPEVVRVLSRDETKQYELAEQLGRPSALRLFLGDVRDRDRLRRAFREADIVFHAAALKHVPSCEYNPFEAVRTNVLGTENVIQAATDEGVQRLVGISTDKAVSPEHTMGATKLLAEKLLTAVNQWTPHLITSCVRFGNVLGSRGSVVPLVRAMIGRGEPVRLTRSEATRFMMTIPQAVALVLRACREATGGQTFILKMPSLRVGDLISVLVEREAERCGRPRASVPVEETGLRPGERLHEQLASADEIERLMDQGDYYCLEPFWQKQPPRLGSRVSIDEVRSDGNIIPRLNRAAIHRLLDKAGW